MKKLLLIALIPILAACNSGKKREIVKFSPIIEKALHDETSHYYADFSKFPAEKRTLPIGVFDSGTGGLTVLEVMLTIDKMDNITGEPGSDGIPDFAGENFTGTGGEGTFENNRNSMQYCHRMGVEFDRHAP